MHRNLYNSIRLAALHLDLGSMSSCDPLRLSFTCYEILVVVASDILQSIHMSIV